MIENKPIGILDYDGYICKAYYAALSNGTDEISDMEEILNNLTVAALQKMKDAYGKSAAIVKVMSGHTFKKDLYPSYKADRKRDEGVGMFREWVECSDDKIIKIPYLEADDIAIMIYDECCKQNNTVVFSDDKDLRYYCPCYCKINLTEEIQTEEDWEQKQLQQMLAGDREDNITGIPKIGMATAKKLLDQCGYSLTNVVKIYKDHDIPMDECAKNLVLVTPICREYVKNYSYGFKEENTLKNILGHSAFFTELVKEIYLDENI